MRSAIFHDFIRYIDFHLLVSRQTMTAIPFNGMDFTFHKRQERAFQLAQDEF
jgi:hypothetical protein